MTTLARDSSNPDKSNTSPSALAVRGGDPAHPPSSAAASTAATPVRQKNQLQRNIDVIPPEV
ncbi:hypothetical protein [Thiohalocapsa sp. ML1]|uniref:hypothetical protein n=1 Tax=Thiohalocapsa sp. ML1 TaxID=1431688 RepID=UPI0020B13ABC|nr:hypothetical protein [Thiohalocapsa sp. ML1]